MKISKVSCQWKLPQPIVEIVPTSPPLEVCLSADRAVENNLAETLVLVETIGCAIASLTAKHFSQPQYLMAESKALIFAAENKLLLPSNKIQQFIGIKPKGEIFSYGSFNFIRSGKIGNQAAWLVAKV